MPSQPEKMKAYWRKNLQTLFILLLIWFVVSFGFGILLVEPLNEFRLGGYKLGFWFAQQGSIYAFVILIFVYVVRMNKLDKESRLKVLSELLNQGYRKKSQQKGSTEQQSQTPKQEKNELSSSERSPSPNQEAV